jgi:O-antigen ligase
VIIRPHGLVASWRPRRVGAPVAGDAIALAASAVVAAAIGAAVATKPVAAVIPAALLGAVLLLVDGRARLLFLVFGGLLTLQSSETLGATKLAYLAGIAVSTAGAVFALSRSTDRFRRGPAMPLLRASVAIFALISISLLIALNHGVSRTDWLRDVAPYALFALAPIFALDAQSAFSRTALVRLLVCAGALATLSFSTYWLQQRNIANLPFSSFALSSFFVPAALAAYAMGAALHSSRGRVRWLTAAALAFSLLVVTGTRSTLLMGLIPIVVAVGARRYLSARFFRLVLIVPLALLLSAAAAYSVVEITDASTSMISERVSILKGTGTSEDASYRDRQAQTAVAIDVFSADPIFGAGPGTYFNWTVSNGEKRSAFLLDTPMTLPAKFGIVGLAVVAFVLVSYGSFLRSMFRFNHPRPETLAFTAYAVVGIANSFLTNPLEDKGWTLGLLLLLPLVLQGARRSVDAEPARARASRSNPPPRPALSIDGRP